jgi:Ca2+-binding EF-hand superfamily protein
MTLISAWCRRVGVVGLIAVMSASVQAGEEGTPQVQGLPKVQSRAAIMKDNETNPRRVQDWVAAFMDGKERKAKLELDIIKKTVQAEEAKRLEEERERQRRDDNYRRSIGDYVPLKREDKASSKIKLDFQVPEIDAYRYASQACTLQATLAKGMADFFSRLDRDGDGKLTEEDYRDAGAANVGAVKVLLPLDANGDGQLTEIELDNAQKIPRNAATAMRQGKSATEIPAYKIKTFDKDANGELSVDEYKAMVMTYVEASVRLESDAAFYKQLADSIAQARVVFAARYAELDVTPDAPKP